MLNHSYIFAVIITFIFVFQKKIHGLVFVFESVLSTYQKLFHEHLRRRMNGE